VPDYHKVIEFYTDIVLFILSVHSCAVFFELLY
jgi:hypothetical protein